MRATRKLSFQVFKPYKQKNFTEGYKIEKENMNVVAAFLLFFSHEQN